MTYVNWRPKRRFEEVAYLLLYGELPTKNRAGCLPGASSKSLRDLPQALKEVLERIPADAHPMDVMRTGCSFLGNLEPELRLRRAARRDRPPAGRLPGDHVLLVSLQP